MRDIIVVTGSAGLIGSEAARLFHAHGHRIIGIDNDMRRHFFGADASTAWNRAKLEQELPAYRHVDADIRNAEAIGKLLAEFGSQVGLIVHAAAQPSHDFHGQCEWDSGDAGEHASPLPRGEFHFYVN